MAAEIDGYGFAEGVADILKKAIDWLTKKVEKVQPKEQIKEKAAKQNSSFK